MTDLQAVARPQSPVAPTSWIARQLLALDASVWAVMVVGSDGKVVAHERDVAHEETSEAEDSSVLFYVPETHFLFLLRLRGRPSKSDFEGALEAALGSPITVYR